MRTIANGQRYICKLVVSVIRINQITLIIETVGSCVFVLYVSSNKHEIDCAGKCSTI